MVGRFSLPSLPSIPALSDLLDTSPQVFYPPSRPASRSSTTATSAVSSSNVSSCPSSPRRRPVAFPDDRGPSPLPPPPFWAGTAHPHIEAPLGAREKPLSQLPRRQSSLGPPADSQWLSARPSHRRSQSAAPTSFTFAPSTAPPLRVEPRNLHPSSSAISLPPLAENDALNASPSRLMPPPPVDLERRKHNRRWSLIGPAPAERSRRRAQSSVTMTSVPGIGTFVEPPLPERLRRRHSQIVGLPSAPVLSKPPTPVCPTTPRSRRSSIVSLTLSDGMTASPSRAHSSVSVSDVAALATWSEEPSSPSPTRRRDSVSSPSEALRARLRTLSKLEGRECPSTPPRRRNTVTSPHSTNVTPGHGTPATPGSSTPTTSSHSHFPPPSPTPTRRRIMHRHSLSLPVAEESRPTTSRLRQPAQLSMAPGIEHLPHRPRPRPSSMLGLPSPLLASSPGSLVSDTGSSSPTASIESLTLSPAWLNLNLTLSAQQKRSSVSSERSRERDRNDRKRNSISSIASVPVSRRGSHASNYDWRRPPATLSTSRPSVSISDDTDGERFLDFDDI
ncbi:uncharacterized protein CcaverHIS019_0110160 [Cutaneotrichosporon cavernicola]|uniref:Uncharacterized protein n=1 Tax=Cutaneotrichosporon cavernicola TaxID=279322 RepID=A0AA48L298_9TREE|nr:uncharacterized protein CcaverHIS019_0110160 [Cutaneotrichosporon cavernicola]BEI88298.1 hypothetical protein CcaverHIS019_0110160 [Cutaneotrichosporon cavernicola]BEI96070.1 hypothetical protein CcaverHIS631_0110190 [Cutaneotrichosporon cavernicola]BEJ03843.1 hypothetical protein CcaverHIS641_0110180 [Cutaneotrichosporon cavernicola]